jgi:hypothetical protein
MPRKVKEPVQVYLDRSDRDLLEQLARQTGLSRAEVLRRGLRQYGSEKLTKPRRSALESIIGIMGDDPSIPTDLSVRHDYYLYGSPAQKHRRDRKRAP